MAEETNLPEGLRPPAVEAGANPAVAAAHRAVTAKHSGEGKKPPGRPRKDGRPAGSGNHAPAPGAQPSGPGDGSPAFRPGVVEKAVGALCATVDRFLQRRTFRTALALTGDRGLADELTADVAMLPEEREQIATLSEAVCLQHGILGQWAPVAFLAVTVGGYSVRAYMVNANLRDLVELQRREAHKAQTSKLRVLQPPSTAGSTASQAGPGSPA